MQNAERKSRGALFFLAMAGKALWTAYQIALGLLLLALLWAGAEAWNYFHVGDIRALRSRPPETTAFMEAARPTAPGGRILWDWIPLDSIPKPLKEMTLVAEDAKFYSHQGFDLEQIEYALVENHQAGRRMRGASTITQQVAKNLYLGGEKELSRKAREAVLALLLEHYLGKDRILEVYLNVAQFGPGVFGVREGARYQFHRDVRDLTPDQMLGLVALLPSPEKWSPRRPTGAYLAHKQRVARNYGLFRGIQGASGAEDSAAYDSLGNYLSEQNWKTLRTGPIDEEDGGDSVVTDSAVSGDTTAIPGPRGAKAWESGQ